MTLYEFIQKEESALKVFGKAEIQIIKKQLSGISLTQSEKNRLSRSIRPKFDFIKKCSVYKEEFEIKKGGEIYKQLEILKEKILLDEIGRKVKRIIVFGSFAENKMSTTSDVDVAIEFYEIDSREASLFKKRILSVKKDIFDISIFNELPKNIQKEVLSNGKIFYESE